MNLSCVPENTIANVTVCNCFQGYYGDECQLELSWYRPVMIAMSAVVTIIMIIVNIWLGLKFRSMKKKLSLAMVTLVSSFFGNVLKIVYLWFPSKVIYNVHQPDSMVFTRTILNYSSLAMEVIATSLVVGFWYEVFHSKMHIKISKVTKSLAIVGASSMLIGLIPGIYFLLIDSILLGIVLIISPILFILILLTIAIVNIIYVKITDHEPKINKRNVERKTWVVKWLSLLLGHWIVFILALFLTIVNNSKFPEFRIVPAFMLMWSYIGVSVAIGGLLDFKWRSLRAVQEKQALTTTTSLNSN